MIFGTFQGHRIFASGKVAEKIEVQTHYAAELYNVDVRQDQRYPGGAVPFTPKNQINDLKNARLKNLAKPAEESEWRSCHE